MEPSDEQPYTVDVTYCDGSAVVHVSGEIDILAKAAVVDAATTVIETHPGRAVVLDMKNVTFLDSSGIAALVELGRRAQDAGAALIVQNPSERARSIVELTGLPGVLLEVQPASET